MFQGETPFCVLIMNFQISSLIKEKRRAFLLTVLFFCLLALFPFQKSQASEITADSVIGLVNKERMASGLNVLAENSMLNQAARDKASDMIKNDYFSHNSPKGTTPWHWIEKSGYDYKYAGENLAINFENAQSQHKAWMASATHRKNILNPNHKEIGVAVAKGKVDGKASVVTVQLFGTQAAAIINKPQENLNKSQEVKVRGEQVSEQNSEKIVSLEPVALFPFPEELKISQLKPDSINIRQPACQNGVCYLSETNSFLSNNKKMSKEAAWLSVIIILILSVALNAFTLSHQHKRNPFIAANTAALLMILTSMVFWKI